MKQKPDNETNPRTPSTLLEALEKWHEDDQFQDIIDAIEALPKEQQTPELISQLARAYNNLAEPGDRHLFKKAVELLKAVQGNITGITGWVMLCIIWTRNPGQSIILKKRWSTGREMRIRWR